MCMYLIVKNGIKTTVYPSAHILQILMENSV